MQSWTLTYTIQTKNKDNYDKVVEFRREHPQITHEEIYMKGVEMFDRVLDK